MIVVLLLLTPGSQNERKPHMRRRLAITDIPVTEIDITKW
jgi:hypothetical protein